MKLVKIEDVVKNNLCIGCGICTNFSTNAKLEYDDNGFLVVKDYIHKNDEISEEELVKNICPGINTYSHSNKEDIIWGDFESINLGYSTNKLIRYKGSSGGTITGTLVYLLENKIVDYVIHIQKDEKDPLGNKVVITDNIETIQENTGSRYCPSSPIKNIFKKLDMNKKYAFVGRPCDVVAISNYEKFNKDMKDIILYKIAFFCAGAPSIKGTEKILENFNLDSSNIKSFRYRGNGWPGYTTAINKSGEEFKMPYGDSWGKILNRHLYPRCKICPDGVGMAADIVYGDGWDCDEKGYPIFTEGDGKSLIIARSKAGKKLVDNLQKDNKLIIEQFDQRNLKSVQPYQFDRRTTLNSRIVAMKLFKKITPLYEKDLVKASKYQSKKRQLKTFLGTVKRIIGKRL